MIALPILAFSPFSLATTPRIVFSLSMTVCGFLLGNFVYKELSSSIHPVVTCAIVAHIAAGLSGLVEGNGWIPGVGSYLSKVSSKSACHSGIILTPIIVACLRN